jgi:hypothetical protein
MSNVFSKGRTFSSIIVRPWEWGVRPGFEPGFPAWNASVVIFSTTAEN